MKIDQLLAGAAAGTRPTVAVPMAHNEEILSCMSRTLGEGIADFLLIGDPEVILGLARGKGVDLTGCTFEEETDEKEACRLAARLAAEGKANVLMKGQAQTSTFMKAVLDREFGLTAPGRLLSHVALMEFRGYDRVLGVTDAAINILPDRDQKREILRNALEILRGAGIAAPRVALGSAVEKVSPKMTSTVDARALSEEAEAGHFGNCLVEGPLSLDVALDAEAARLKGIDSRIAGGTDLMVAPNIESANFLYKTLTRFLDARVAGAVAGCRVPLVLTSRADSEEAKYLSLKLAARLAENREI